MESFNSSPRARMRALRLRVVAGLGGVESFPIESCDTDVEGVLVDELEGPVDNPRTTMGTQFSVLHCIFLFSFWVQRNVFDHWFTHRSIRDLRKVFQAIVLEDLHCHE